jgi:dTDP-4-dehydrorhamnose 3,5-epimerase-like enzyme
MDADGILIPIEFDSLPFIPKRIFIVKNVPICEERGNHAHYETQQILVCLKGKIEVKLYDGQSVSNYVLNEGESIFIDKMIWDSQIFHTGDDVLLSICSTEYNPMDYINNLDEFNDLFKDKDASMV